MDEKILEVIRKLKGKECCRVKVGEYKSLSLGFGKRIYHNNPKLNDTYYGEWEIGTYYCAWRIIQDGQILCDPIDAEEKELAFCVKKLTFGKFLFLEQLNNFDVRVRLENGFVVDFLSSTSDDEYFHIFAPKNQYVELRQGGIWALGRTDQPWEEKN